MISPLVSKLITSTTLMGVVVSVATASEAVVARGPKIPDEEFHAATFVALGLGIVLGILILLALATSLIGKVFIVFENKKIKRHVKTQPIKVSENTTAVKPVESTDESELIAVLAAAAMEVLEADVRIISYKPSFTNWSREGRINQTSMVNK